MSHKGPNKNKNKNKETSRKQNGKRPEKQQK